MSPLHRPGALAEPMMGDAANELGGESTVSVALPVFAEERPRTRGECPTSRPCPWVGCRYHLYLEVDPRTGRLFLNFPDLEPWELTETCALDVAERTAAGVEVTLEEVGELMDLSKGGVRHVASCALAKLRARLEHSKPGAP